MYIYLYIITHNCTVVFRHAGVHRDLDIMCKATWIRVMSAYEHNVCI